MTRPSRDTLMIGLAHLMSLRGTCARRKVGCVLTNPRGHVLATGYNGPASGEPHCTSSPCSGATAAPGTGLSVCEAIHAEVNAVLQCHDVHAIDTVYCTASPCRDCVKILMNTSAKRVVFLQEYPHPESRDLWTRAGREWVQLPQGDFDKMVHKFAESCHVSA